VNERIRNEPIDFVKNALVCGDHVPSIHVDRHCMSQRNGTAAQSLASEHLQELESLVGSERQKQEEIIKVAMGSMYLGETLYSWIGYMGFTRPLFSRFRHCTFSIYFHTLLTDSDIPDCIIDVLPLSSLSPIPAGAKTSASRT